MLIFKNMITTLKIQVPVILALIVVLESGRPSPVFGGCYCMMESKTIGAGYNKTGFYQFTPHNGPVQVFLHSKTIQNAECHYSYSDANYFSKTDWSYSYVNDVRFNLSSVNIVANPPEGCRYFTLPSTQTSTIKANGSSASSDSSFTWHYNNNNGNTEGAWHQEQSGLPPQDGSDCEGIVVDLFRGYEGSYNWPWVETLYTLRAEGYEWKSEFYVDSSGDGNSHISCGNRHDIVLLTELFSDKMLREQVIARLPEWPEKWSGGSGTAAYSLDSEHICASGSKMQYRVIVPDSIKNAIYTLEWSEETVNGTNTTSVPQKEFVKGNGDPLNPAVGITHDIDMPSDGISISETAPVVTDVTYPSGGPGGPPPPPPGTGHTGTPGKKI